jgi:hypothetical protein
MLFFEGREGGRPSWSFGPLPEWRLPAIQSDLTSGLCFRVPDVEVSGYDYDHGDQPYHVELWIEKSTMDDVLLPLCRRFAVNLVRGIGFQSITGAVRLLQRVQRLRRVAAEKPCRVFYLSDFDPGGHQMPVAVARQVEFWLPQYAPGADVKLTPLVMTKEQVRRYALPRVPIKDSDRRKAGFEERHGEGAVELDALEAVFPGELANIVRAAVAPYRDEGLEERLEEVGEEAVGCVEEDWARATAGQREELQAVEEEAAAVLADYQGRLEEMDAELQGRLAPLRGRLAAVRHGVEAAMAAFDPDLPDRPGPEVAGAEELGWLFASSRKYLEQLGHYKAYKAGIASERGGVP